MVSNISDPIGAVWLMSVFNIKPAFRFAVVSGISTRRKTEIEKETGFRQEWYPESYRPTNTVAAHLQLHLLK